VSEQKDKSAASTVTAWIGRTAGVLLDAIVRVLALTRIPPNYLTFFGLVVNSAAAVAFGYGEFFWAGVIIFLAGIFDMTDGRVARVTNRVSPFGGFFDSVIDRYSDLVLYFGLLVYYARVNRFFYIVLTALAMVGSVMVSYVRARAESLIVTCKVGFMERPERIVLLIIGAVFDRMAPVLWVIATLSNITVVHRIWYTRQICRERAAQAAQPTPPTQETPLPAAH
jgi:CDP-diacylglycerol--glycerol-3-phosphate 3-phosphatidyltransferase